MNFLPWTSPTTTSLQPIAVTWAYFRAPSPPSGGYVPRSWPASTTTFDRDRAPRLPVGDIPLSKLGPTFENLVAVEGELTGYAGYPGSDFRNGAVIRVPNGPRSWKGYLRTARS